MEKTVDFVGFTGTQVGMTYAQSEIMEEVLRQEQEARGCQN